MLPDSVMTSQKEWPKLAVWILPPFKPIGPTAGIAVKLGLA
jgi:hypothetical protein